MGLMRYRCPVPDGVRDWIDDSLEWSVSEFGGQALLRPVLLPSAAFFPRSFTGTHAQVLEIVDGMCRHMGVDPGLVGVDYRYEEADEAELPRACRRCTVGPTARQGTTAGSTVALR
jgi:hypothetical protein